MTAFIEWLDSPGNPFVNASESVRHSTKEALRAAFNAGKEDAHNAAIKFMQQTLNFSASYVSLGG